MPKYYGEWEVSKETPTQDENAVVLSFLPEKSKEGKDIPLDDLLVPLFVYDTLVTDEPVDWATHLERRINPVVGEIMQIFHKYNVTVGQGNGVKSDLSYILDEIDGKIIQSRYLVFNWKWGAKPHMQTMQQLNAHFKEMTKE